MIVVRAPTASAWPPIPFDVDTLRSQFQTFMHSLQSIIDVQDEDQRPFYLSEIQFSAEIAANGEFKLPGTGLGVQASSTVTFVLQRSENRQPVSSASGSTERG